MKHSKDGEDVFYIVPKVGWGPMDRVTRRKISVQQKEKLSNNLGFIKLKWIDQLVVNVLERILELSWDWDKMIPILRVLLKLRVNREKN